MLADKERSANKIDSILTLFCSVVAAAFFYSIYKLRIIGAYQDMWDMLFYLKYLDQHQLTLAHFFEKHYGTHVLAIPKLLYLADYRWFHGQCLFLLAVSVACLVASHFIVMARIQYTESAWQRRILILGTTLVLLGGWQVPNLVFTFQVQWYLSLLLSLLAFVCLERYYESGSCLAAVLLTAGMSALCGFSGVIAFVVVLVFLSFRVGTRSRLAIVLCLLATFWYCWPGDIRYRLTETQAVHLDLEHFLARLNIGGRAFFPYFFILLAAWFGNPVTMIQDVAGCIAGFGVLVYLVLALYGVARKNGTINFWIMLTVYALVLVACIALGRYQSGSGSENRYVTAYSLVLIVFFYWLVQSTGRRVQSMMMSVFILALVWTGVIQIRDEIDETILLEKSDINILNGIYQNMAYHKADFYAELMGFNPAAYFHDYLKQGNLDIFYGQLERINPADITDHQCRGTVKRGYLLPQNQIRDYYLRLWDYSQDVPIVAWYLTENDRVRFYGTTYATRAFLLPIQYQTLEHLESYTSIPAPYTLKDFVLTGVNSQGAYCHIALE